jgi:hypothetical protein
VGKSTGHSCSDTIEELKRGDLVEYILSDGNSDPCMDKLIGVVVWGVHEWHPEMISPGWNVATNTFAWVWLENQCQLVSVKRLKRLL